MKSPFDRAHGAGRLSGLPVFRLGPALIIPPWPEDDQDHFINEIVFCGQNS